MTLKDLAQAFVERMKPRIGTGLMVGKHAQIGDPVTKEVFVTGGNFPDGKQVYVHFINESDVTSVVEALIADKSKKDLAYERPVIINKNDEGFYYIERVEPVRDAIYSEGVEQLDDQLPVYNRQLIEQATIHPIAGALQVQVSSGLLGEYYFSGQASGVFSTGTVQDTSAANITEATTNGKAKGILIQIDAATETIEYKQSAEFAGILSLQQAYKAGLLPTVDSGKELRGYVKWAKGATIFTIADIWNVGSIASGNNTDITADTLTLADGSELTIASGAITVTHTRHTVDTEADADTDDLITVNGLAANEICLITANHTDRTIVVKNSGGNITCATGTDIWLDDTVKAVLLMGNTAGTGVWAYAIGTAFPVPDTQILMFNPDVPQGKLKFSIALLENATRTVSWIDENITPLGTNNIQTFFNKNSGNQFRVGANQDEIQFQVTGNATQTADIVVFQRSNGDDLFVVRQSEIIFNEAGLDIDTRIKTNNDADAFVVNGGTDNVGFGTETPDASAKVDIVSTTKGFLPPRMTSAQWAAIGSPANGLIAYDTDSHQFVGIKNGASSVIGGLYTSVAILRDEKTSATAGGSSSATTWNNRNLNTESYDPDGIVTISSNQFTPIAGDYEITVAAGVFKSNLNRLRLYNVTGTASVEEGLNQSSNAADATTTTTTLHAKFTANGTDAYRIDHYTSAAQATNGLGAAVSDGSAEVYMEIILRKLA